MIIGPHTPDFAAGLEETQQKELAESSRDLRLATLARLLGKPAHEALAWLAQHSHLPLASELKVDAASLSLLPARLVHEYQIIPLANDVDPANDQANPPLVLACSWPPEIEMVDWIATFTSRPLTWFLAPPDRLRQLVIENYGVGSGSLDDSDNQTFQTDSSTPADAEVDEEAAVVRFVSEVISQAITDEATDIHFEPQEGQLRIRYRVDGLLVPVPVPENLLRFQDAVISRLKIMARLNISERRLPQDGRITFKAGDANLDIRVSTIPTIYAESVSLRLLNQKREAYTMEKLGMSAGEQAQVSRILEYPHGIVLVTGPTGSGKSTSLNAYLRKINSTDLRIVTIEDPIEYEVPGANQMQVRPEIGLTFASALRHVLRQDPDVIMVGEIRDRDTADIAIRASLTGHLVFSTLHTNDAAGAITRLIDMGVEPFLVASAVELVVAQRLVRRLCPDCARAEPVQPQRIRETLAVLGLETHLADNVTSLKQPVGCNRCRGTGYRGRIGLFEILHPNEALHDLIVRRESSRALTEQARKDGMQTLQQSGWEKVCAGHTTLDEVLRVITVAEK